MWRVKSLYPNGARAIGVPGWPELAFCTASMDSVRTVLMQSASRLVFGIPKHKDARAVAPHGRLWRTMVLELRPPRAYPRDRDRRTTSRRLENADRRPPPLTRSRECAP